jgi:ABC-type antimicrobial peptide transport system permease subunit
MPSWRRALTAWSSQSREPPYALLARAGGIENDLAVQNQDYTLTQALVMLTVAVFVLANLAVDLLYAWLDPRFLIMLTAFVGQAILAEASLSYLGLGVQEPVAAWGLMLQGGAEEYASTAPWIAVFPGLAITLTVFGFSLFGDALRDAIDPKLRDR